MSGRNRCDALDWTFVTGKLEGGGSRFLHSVSTHLQEYRELFIRCAATRPLLDIICALFISGGRLAGSSAGPNLGQSVFDYIEKQNARSTLFYNFMYTPDTEHPVRFQFLTIYATN